MSHDFTTPTARARGLGSAKAGTEHHIRQRVSAIALIFLVPWFLFSVINAVQGGYDGALDWVAQPWNAVLLILTFGAAIYHMRLGMQIVIEGLALSAFATTRETTPDPVLKDVVYLVTRDEARHVTFGVNYLEEFVKTLTDEEREERAQFAYEACAISRERLVATDVFRHFGWDVEEARQKVLDGFVMSTFRNLLFQRVIPNLKRIGLLTDSVKPKFESLGILEYENLATDGDIDWSALERPLDTGEAQSYEQTMLDEFAKAHESHDAEAARTDAA